MSIAAPAQTYEIKAPVEPTEWDKTHIDWLNRLTAELPILENGKIDLKAIHTLGREIEPVAHVDSVMDWPAISAILDIKDTVKAMTHEDASGNIRPLGFIGHSLHKSLTKLNAALDSGPLQLTEEGAEFHAGVKRCRDIYAGMSHSGFGTGPFFSSPA